MNGAAVRSWEGKIETQSAETRSGPDNQEGFSETFNFYNQVDPLYLKK